MARYWVYVKDSTRSLVPEMRSPNKKQVLSVMTVIDTLHHEARYNVDKYEHAASVCNHHHTDIT